MALIREYFELTKKYQDDYGSATILFMEVGSFFEVYALRHKVLKTITGSQILDYARICDLAIAEKNVTIDDNDCLMAGFKNSYVEKYIRKMQDAGFTIVVYSQDEQAANTGRHLSGIFSPGTFFSTEESAITNNIVCVWIELIENSLGLLSKSIASREKFVEVGVAVIDIYTGKSSIFQFKELYVNNPTTYDDLERFISIHQPNEAIVISNLPLAEIDDIINYANIQCKTLHKISTESSTKNSMHTRAANAEKQIYQKEILARFFSNLYSDYDIFLQNFYENNFATQAYCFLLDFVYQHNPYLINKISEPLFENGSDRLILANHSLKQLNIIDDHNHNGKYSSVVKMLNMCITSMGKRKFSYQFLNPITNTAILEAEYNITEHIINGFNNYEFIKHELAEIKDISKISRQIILKKISPLNFYQLFKNLETIRDIHTKIITDPIFSAYLINKLGDSFVDISSEAETIVQVILKGLMIDMCNDIPETQHFDTNFICKDVDAELDQKTLIMSNSYDKLEAIRVFFNANIEKFEKKTKSTKTTDYLKINETDKNHFSLVGTKRRCALLKTALPKSDDSDSASVKLSYISSSTGATESFIFHCSASSIVLTPQGSGANNIVMNPEIHDICKNISNIKMQMKSILNRVYNEFVFAFEKNLNKLESIISFITLTDIAYAKARLAIKYNYCKPVIDTKASNKKSYFNVTGLRHCLIEHLQQTELYVTNDLELGSTSGMDGLLLYGTNAVGKTSFIRACGIAIIMAQSGLYVPASTFIYKPYKYIFTRILGNDNIFKGLSTFAVEMSELRTILRLANENSLILGDELCSGTESISAVSIFVAGIQQMHTKGSSFIFATHLHEIVDYEEILEMTRVNIKHMAVIYDRKRGILVYDRTLKDGPGDNMYGLEVCKSLNLPQDFLDLAHSIRVKYHPKSDSILDLKTSHFNAKKIMGLCEKCGVNIGTEVHHLQHQADSNENGIISMSSGTVFHKNHTANLATLCEKCHNKFHDESNKTHKRVKTTKGMQMKPIVNTSL